MKRRKNKRKKVFYGAILILFLIFGIVFWINRQERVTNADTVSQSEQNQSAVQNGSLPTIAAANTIADSEKLKEYRVPILMYHYIRDYDNPKDKTGTSLSVSPARFDEQMKWLSENNYKTVDFNYFDKPYAISHKPIILTFDDGYKDAYTDAYPILKKYNMTATFYLISAEIDKANDRYMSWDQAKELKNYGINIGSHTISHPGLDKANDERVDKELKESKKIIEEKIGVPISDFCYPAGKYDGRVLNKLKEAGYKTATTVKNGIADQNSNLFELPRIRMQNNTNLGNILSDK